MNIVTPIWPLLATLLSLGSFLNFDYILCEGAETTEPNVRTNPSTQTSSSQTSGPDDNEEHDWSYHGAKGPSNWKNRFPDCGLKAQSPIDLNPATAVEVEIAVNDLFEVSGYNNVRGRCVITNDGHHGYVKMAGNEWKIRGGVLKKNKYILQEFHFHWGENETLGSEHTVTGERFPLEMHLVHHLEGSSDDQNVKAVAVLGVLFRVGKEDNFMYRSIIDGLGRTKYNDQTSWLSMFRLRDMLPTDMNSYYSYIGSYTTPPCTEDVQWIVFNDTVHLSAKQIDAFRGLKALAENDTNADNTPMTNTFRPVQPLRGRTIHAVRAKKITMEEREEIEELEILQEEAAQSYKQSKNAVGEAYAGSQVLIVLLTMCRFFV